MHLKLLLLRIKFTLSCLLHPAQYFFCQSINIFYAATITISYRIRNSWVKLLSQFHLCQKFLSFNFSMSNSTAWRKLKTNLLALCSWSWWGSSSCHFVGQVSQVSIFSRYHSRDHPPSGPSLSRAVTGQVATAQATAAQATAAQAAAQATPAYGQPFPQFLKPIWPSARWVTFNLTCCSQMVIEHQIFA